MTLTTKSESVPVVETFYTWLTYSVIGIVDGRHTIYIGIIGFLLVYVFYMTTKVSMMDDRIQELISTAAILEKQLRDLEREREAVEGSASDGAEPPSP